MAEPHIIFDEVEVSYNEFVAGLRGISLTIDKGEFVFLCGQTGSGKSTMLKVLSREVRHTGGKIMLGGRNLSSVQLPDVPYLRRQMGIIPQDFALLPQKRVWENVAYAMRAVGKTKREVRKTVPQILERVNILHRADAFPRELSGGEQQRVAIARALINNPPLLLADELTANLDPTTSAEIMKLLMQLNLRGTTILVATHDMLVVEEFKQRIVRLEGGKIISDEHPDPEDARHEIEEAAEDA